MRIEIAARRIALTASLLAAAVPVATAQQAPSADPLAETTAAMEPFAWLVGEWQGEASIQTGPDHREKVVQTERVESRLDGRVLVVEGIGRDQASDGSIGEVVHHALGLLSYDPDRDRYIFHAFRDGRVVEAETSFEEGVFTWGFDAPGAGRARYHIRQVDGEWQESGEFSRDGVAWQPFFEMRLRRVAAGGEGR